METSVAVRVDSGAIVLDGRALGGLELEEGETWAAHKLANTAFYLKRGHHSTTDGAVIGLGRCPVEVFADYLAGAHNRHWTGVIALDAGGTKTIYFDRGEIIFASSTLMDDRLGEVMYRSGQITLDQLTESAIKVTREHKFGQVLLRDGLFSATNLWNALKLQVHSILASIFILDEVHFEIISPTPRPGSVPGATAPMRLSFFPKRTDELIRECASFGVAYRDFAASLGTDSQVSLTMTGLDLEQIPEGTFTRDMLNLVEKNANVEDIVGSSKLSRANTLAAVMHLVEASRCVISAISPRSEGIVSGLGGLKGALDSYSMLLNIAREPFESADLPFPVVDLKTFAASLCDEQFQSLYLTDEGDVAPESVRSLMAQCRRDTTRANYFECLLATLTDFLQQICGDFLPMEASRALVGQFKKIRA